MVPDVIEKLQEQHDVIVNFHPTPHYLSEMIVDREVVILRSGIYLAADVLALAPDLKVVIRAGSGFDNIDIDYLNQHNIYLARIPEPGARAVAELTFGFMIALARQLRVADEATREGHWIKTYVEGYLLNGKTLGIVGVGNIGRTVAKMANAWNMRVIGCVENCRPEIVDIYRSMDVEIVSLQQVLSESDFVSLHDSTRNLIDVEELALMKPGAFLINLARGGVVNEQALYHSLISKSIKGCALDVHIEEGEGIISPLAGLPNVLLTPHMGAQTVDTQVKIGNRILEIMGGMKTI